MTLSVALMMSTSCASGPDSSAVPILEVSGSERSRSLDIGTSTCQAHLQVEVEEAGDRVIIYVKRTDVPPSGYRATCVDVKTVELGRDLGHRVVIDGLTGEEVRFLSEG